MIPTLSFVLFFGFLQSAALAAPHHPIPVAFALPGTLRPAAVGPDGGIVKPTANPANATVLAAPTAVVTDSPPLDAGDATASLPVATESADATIIPSAEAPTAAGGETAAPPSATVDPNAPAESATDAATATAVPEEASCAGPTATVTVTVRAGNGGQRVRTRRPERTASPSAALPEPSAAVPPVGASADTANV